MENNNLAIFYCGTNGAGKSTLRSLNSDAVQVVIDSDHIAQEINPHNPRLADIRAGRKAVALFDFAIENRISFSMESTLSGRSVLQRIKTAKHNGFCVRLNYVGVNNVRINIERVAARVKIGGHFIDEASIRRRYQSSAEHLLQAVPLCDDVFVYDNSGEHVQLVFWINQREINLMSNKLPEWCRSLQTQLQQLDYHTVSF
ncbi:zeta toxin family protein [Neisseria sp.]|uniref:zeta toxin family protein n=1 Tax=Neisseria sp. TaxID=192066 RepID=UPI0026DD9224|nr:zeta toxin family protein [Neisseria sp.]MDO4907669.1 zeta toxin family protein [Neisseria sp.]